MQAPPRVPPAVPSPPVLFQAPDQVSRRSLPQLFSAARFLQDKVEQQEEQDQDAGQQYQATDQPALAGRAFLFLMGAGRLPLCHVPHYTGNLPRLRHVPRSGGCKPGLRPQWVARLQLLADGRSSGVPCGGGPAWRGRRYMPSSETAL